MKKNYQHALVRKSNQIQETTGLLSLDLEEFCCPNSGWKARILVTPALYPLFKSLLEKIRILFSSQVQRYVQHDFVCITTTTWGSSSQFKLQLFAILTYYPNLRGFLFRSVQLLCTEYRDSAKIVTKHLLTLNQRPSL